MFSNPFNPLSGATSGLSNPFAGDDSNATEKEEKKDKKNREKQEKEQLEEDLEREEGGAEEAEALEADFLRDMGGGDEDEEDNLSPDAIAWVKEHFDGDRSYGKYYHLAKDRDAQDIKDLCKKRKWRVRLTRIQYTNHDKLGDFFVCFNFGWNFRLRRKLLRLKASGSKAKKDANGRPAEQKRQWKWVKSGERGKTRYTEVKKDVDKGRPVEFNRLIEFTWEGSYFELYDKVLHAEVWVWHEFAPNEFLAKAEKPLKEIASGEMNMKGAEWEIKTEIRRRGRREQVVLGSLEFQCVFQEVLSYSIRFQNWTSIFSPWYVKPEPKDLTQAIPLYPWVQFRLHSALNPSYAASSKKKSVMVTHPEMVKMDVGQVPSIRFVGTRLELEEGTLYLDLFDNSSQFVNELLGQAHIPLTMVVENGFLSSKLVLKKLSRTMSTCQSIFFCCAAAVDTSSGGAKLQNVGQVYGSVDIDAEETMQWGDLLTRPGALLRGQRLPARLHREFAQVGELYPPELKDFAPYNYSYLAVHIIAARDLIGADANGLSDPYVTVSWGGQRLKTRTLFETLDPVFDETLYFRIHSFDPLRISVDELAADPFVRITLWDADETGSSDLLGTTKLYLHQITGCIDDPQFPLLRPRNLVVRRGKKNKRKLKEEEIQTRVFTEELRLEGLPNGVDSFVKIAAWFRGPDGDLKEGDELRRQEQGSDLLILPNMKTRETEMLLPCICFPVDAVVRGSYPPRRQVCADCHEDGSCATLKEFEKQLRRRVRVASGVKEILQVMRLDKFSAMNQYGDVHFLPTFLQPISPPKAMLKQGTEKERQYLAIRTSEKPNLLFEAAGFVRGIEFEDLSSNSSYFDGAVNINPYTWLSPDFFLSMKKGDVKAHVLLLCNLFLGLTADAYVCVGYARRKLTEKELHGSKHKEIQESLADSYQGKSAVSFSSNQQDKHKNDPKESELIPHVWIMTRHSTSLSCVKRELGQIEKTNSSPDEEDLEHNKEQEALPMDLRGVGGAVKFWEVTHGAYYPPLPNRWEGQDDEDMYKKLNTLKRENVRKVRGNKEGTGAVIDDKNNNVAGGLWQDAQELTEDDMLDADNTDHGDLTDQFVQVDEIFELGAGTGDSFGAPERRFGLGGNGQDGDGVFGGDGDGLSQVGTEGQVLEEEEEEEEEESEEEGDIEDDPAKKEAYEKKRAFKEKLSRWKLRSEWTKRHFQRNKDRLHMQMPYEKLLFVFNHRNLWVNIQESSDPRQISYDIEDGEKFGWQPLVKHDPKTLMTVFTSHYAGRTLGPKLTEEKVTELQNAMTQEIMSGIENFRNSHNVATRFAETATRIPKCIQDVLETKHRLELTDKVSMNGWIPAGKNGRWRPDSIGEKHQKDFESAFRKLHSKTPPGYTGRIHLVKVNSSDPKEVRRIVLRRRTTKGKSGKPVVGIHEESHNGQESFAVGVKVVSYPSSICIVYVGVMVIFPKTDAAELEAEHTYR